MNITTRSGKTIEVDDESYVIDLGSGVVKYIFTSTQAERMYTIDDDDIEIFDETLTDERLAAIIDTMGSVRSTSDEDPMIGYV